MVHAVAVNDNLLLLSLLSRLHGYTYARMYSVGRTPIIIVTLILGQFAIIGDTVPGNSKKSRCLRVNNCNFSVLGTVNRLRFREWERLFVLGWGDEYSSCLKCDLNIDRR